MSVESGELGGLSSTGAYQDTLPLVCDPSLSGRKSVLPLVTSFSTAPSRMLQHTARCLGEEVKQKGGLSWKSHARKTSKSQPTGNRSEFKSDAVERLPSSSIVQGEATQRLSTKVCSGSRGQDELINSQSPWKSMSSSTQWAGISLEQSFHSDVRLVS